MLVVYALVRGKPFLFEMSQGYILPLIYLTIFGSFVGYGTYFALLGRIGPEPTPIRRYSQALALGVSTALEGLTWRAEMLVGASLIFGGNVAILLKQKPPSPSPRQGN